MCCWWAANKGFGGAVLLAAEACARSGAGLVSVATRPQHITALLTRCPTVMVHAVNSGLELQPLVMRADVLALGPGAGTGQLGWNCYYSRCCRLLSLWCWTRRAEFAGVAGLAL